MLDQHPFKPVFVIVKPLEGIGASSVANIPDMDASSAADSAVWEPLVVPVTGSSALMAGMVSDRETSLPVSGTASQDDLETQGITVCNSTASLLACDEMLCPIVQVLVKTQGPWARLVGRLQAKLEHASVPTIFYSTCSAEKAALFRCLQDTQTRGTQVDSSVSTFA